MLIKSLSLCVLSVIGLASCSNAVSYHHSERSSIALELRTSDPQQPIQGIIGVKTRTIVVAPGVGPNVGPNDEGISLSDKGESTSVISDFKLKRSPSDDFFGFGTTTVQSAFITGDAAKNAPSSTSNALSGIGIASASDQATLQRNVMENIYRFLSLRNANDAVAKQHIDRLNKLAKLLPDNYASKIYYDISSNVLIKQDNSGYTPKKDGFLEVLQYEKSFLGGSITSIETMEIDRTIKFKASSGAAATNITMADLTLLKSELKRLQDEKRTFFDLIGNHNAIDSAAAYMVSKL
ncbi:MAG: hypothetical protein ACJA2G_003654 [Cognaticolwellia sp.]|jgi:hypothetical protein